MAEHDAGAESQEAFGLGGLGGRSGDPEPFGRTPDEGWVADRVSRRDEQQPACVLREPRQPPPVAG